MAPDISIIIPVLHEVGTINKQLAHCLYHKEPVSTEIIVVDGDSKGSTIKHIPYSVKTITSKTGRGYQLNSGAKLASGAILLFLHADTILPPGAFSSIMNTCTVSLQVLLTLVLTAITGL